MRDVLSLGQFWLRRLQALLRKQLVLGSPFALALLQGVPRGGPGSSAEVCRTQKRQERGTELGLVTGWRGLCSAGQQDLISPSSPASLLNSLR